MSFKNTFSERLGLTENRPFQQDDMDYGLRNSIWNSVYPVLNHYYNNSVTDFENVIGFIWEEFFVQPIDEMQSSRMVLLSNVKSTIYKDNWYKVYDLLELLLLLVEKHQLPRIDILRKNINYSLENENSAYRVIENEIVLITDTNEIDEIERALNDTVGRFEGVHTHLQMSLRLLSDREKPDYRNSIKESISAVESICKIICGSEKADLRTALNRLNKKGLDLHGALKEGFEKLYAYTSDEKGIRHALIDFSNATFEDAKYMLVSCTTFVNYLIVKAEKAGIFAMQDEGGADE